MLVYRVQHKKTGDGPYTGEGWVCGMGSSHSDPGHPSPWEDTQPVQNFIRKHGGDAHLVHGFDSLKALHAWFSGWEEQINAVGNEVVVFEVPLGSYRRGKQVVFWRNKSKIVDRFPITKNV